jgi:hypothetical protein
MICLFSEFDIDDVWDSDVEADDEAESECGSFDTLIVFMQHLSFGSTFNDDEETDDGSQFGTCMLYCNEKVSIED